MNVPGHRCHARDGGSGRRVRPVPPSGSGSSSGGDLAVPYQQSVAGDAELPTGRRRQPRRPAHTQRRRTLQGAEHRRAPDQQAESLAGIATRYDKTPESNLTASTSAPPCVDDGRTLVLDHLRARATEGHHKRDHERPHAARRIRLRSRSKLARPNICRLIILILLLWPSMAPEL
jgi:hypothetical protein